MTLAAKHLARDPHQLRRFPHGQPAVVEVAGDTVGRAVFRARLALVRSRLAGTDSCQVDSQ